MCRVIRCPNRLLAEPGWESLTGCGGFNYHITFNHQILYRHFQEFQRISLLDISVDDKTVQRVGRLHSHESAGAKIDILRTRSTGPGFFVEVEICCAKPLRSNKHMRIAQDVHDRIERDFPRVKHVMVHTNPCDIK